ncbi:MAG: molybdenum cofactor biosynthesis protein MoaE [Chthonomonadales bacterium]
MADARSKRRNSSQSSRIVRDPIDTAALTRLVSGPRNGAVVTFIGQVRNHSHGRKVAYLEYDAYVPMAEKLIRRLAAEASERWPVDAVIEHRIGRMEVGEISVAICVGSPHRAEAFEACRWLIDTLKETVPIWKKEVGPDGTYWVEGDDLVPPP